MGNKDRLVSFRTTDSNVEYLHKLAESDERSLSYVLNKMVDAFRTEGIKKVSKIKVSPSKWIEEYDERE